MISPLSAPQTSRIARPPLSVRTAPPGASFASVPSDRVALSQAPPEPAPEPARISRKAWVALALASVAAAAGGIAAVSAHPGLEAAASAPAISAVAPVERAPVTVAWDGDLDARPELTSVGLREVPSTRAFSGEALKIAHEKGTETNGLGGRLDWTVSTLEDSHSHHSWMLSRLDSVRQEFQAEAASEWTAHFQMEPAGNAGRLVSVVLREGGYQGGMHPSEQVTLRTFDRETGSPVRLDELLAPHDLEDLADVVKAKLAGPGAEEFQHDEAGLLEWINTSFSVREEGGRTVVTVAIPHGAESAGGSTARFTFQLAPGVDIANAR